MDGVNYFQNLYVNRRLGTFFARVTGGVAVCGGVVKVVALHVAYL